MKYSFWVLGNLRGNGHEERRGEKARFVEGKTPRAFGLLFSGAQAKRSGNFIERPQCF
jgi:hypothetical protein